MAGVDENISAPPGAEVKPPFPRNTLLGAAVDCAEPDAVVNFLIERAENRAGISVVGLSAPYVMAMRADGAMRDAFLGADVLLPDGKGVAWAAKMLGVPCGERIAIPDLCEKLFEAGAQRRWRVFIYGATEETNTKACENLKARFPGQLAVEGQHGYNQSAANEDEIVQRLKDGQFHLVIVARPSPAKEIFLNRCCAGAGVVGIAAGGYADILAGATRRAPQFIQEAGFEWLFRVVQEPRRLWKRIGVANLKFAMLVLWEHLRSPARRPWWSCPAIHVAAITLALTVAYSGFLSVPYHFDDPDYIQRNTTIRSFSKLSEITVLAHRKIWWVSNAVCYKLSEWFGVHQENKPDVRIFRAWNIGCHLVAALALFALLRRCLRARGIANAGGADDLIPVGAALLFAAHPLATESVTYISGRDNGQGGMFYLLGMYFAAVMFERMHRTPGAAAEWPGWFWPGAAMIAMGGCSVLTKESHLTFPAAVALIYLYFYRSPSAPTISLGLILGIVLSMSTLAWGAAGRREGYLAPATQVMLALALAGAAAGQAKSDAPFFRFLRRRVNIGWGFLAAVAGLGIASIAAFPYAYKRTFAALTGDQNSDFVRSLWTQANAVPQMLLRAIAPIHTGPAGGYGLNIDHEFPTLTRFSDPRVLLGSAVIAALVIFGFAGLRRRSLAAFAVLFALISIASTNSIFERGDIVSERNFYLAAAAGSVFLAWAASEVARIIARFSPVETQATPFESGMWTALLCACLACPFVSFTVLRNHEWHDPYMLWESALSRSPGKMRVLYNFGVVAWARRHFDEAENALSNAIKIGEEKSDKHLFRPDEAVEVKCFYFSYARLAQLYVEREAETVKKGNLTSLVRVQEIYKRGFERTAYDPDIAFSYGMLLIQLGRPAEAVPILQKSLDLHTWADQLYMPLGFALLESNRLTDAARYLTLALNVKQETALGPKEDIPIEIRAEIHAFLAAAQVLQKQPGEAKGNFCQSLKLDPRAAIMLITSSGVIRNRRLKPQDFDPPDPFATAASVTRREILLPLIEQIEHALPDARPRDKTILNMLRNALHSEIKRRDDIQKKRVRAGFKDDPEAPQ